MRTCSTHLSLFVSALAGMVCLCLAQNGPTPESLDRSDTSLTGRPTTASDVASRPGAYYGKTVGVRSDVTRIFSDHVFTLTDQPLLAAPEVLVLVPQPASKVTEDFTVTAIGVVRPFNATALQRMYPWFNSRLFDDPGLIDRWRRDQTPVLVATSVQTEDGVELVRTTPARSPAAVGSSSKTVTGHGRGAELPVPVTSLGTVFRADNDHSWDGNPIALRAIAVQRVFSPEWIVIGTDVNHQLLVRLPQPTSMSPGTSVNVSGILRTLPSPLQDWGFDSQQIRFAQKQPIYISATRVDPVGR
jgi:hypothetical protein